MTQVFGGFDTDKAAADNDGVFLGLIVNESFDFVGVGQMFDHEMRQVFNSFDRRDERLDPCGKHKLVIRISLSVGGNDFLFFGIDARDGHVQLDFYVKQVFEQSRFCDLHIVSVFDDAADVIGQAAAGDGGFVRFFKDCDFSRIVEPS